MNERMKYFAAGIALVAAVAGYSYFQGSSSSGAPQNQANAPQAPQQNANAPALNPISQAFAQHGISTCLPRITQVTNFMGAGDGAGAFIFPHAKEDFGLLSTAMEIGNDKGLVAYAAASFAASGKNQCGGTYDVVAYWPEICTEVAKKQFNGAKLTTIVRKNIGVLDLGPASRAYFLPAGKEGCVTIKKEVVL